MEASGRRRTRWPAWIDALIGRLAAIEFSPLMLAVVPIAVAAGRGSAELLMTESRSFSVPLLNYVLCYSLLQLSILGVLRLTTGIDHRRLVGLISVGLFLGWLPPIIDTALRLAGVDQGNAWYLYPKSIDWNLFARYELVGESIALWLSILLAGVVAGWLTGSWRRGFAASLLTYVVIQVVAWALPAASTEIRGVARDMRRHVPLNWLYLFAIGSLYVVLNRRTMVPSLLRVAHALPWGLLVAVGTALSGQGWDVAVNRGLVMVLAAQLAIHANDYFDREMDGMAGGRARPVSRDDLIFIAFLHVVLIAQAHAVEKRALVFPVTFVVLWATYHLPTIRAKRVLGIPYLFEGIGAALCILYGMYSTRGFSTEQDVVLLVAGLAFAGFLIGSALKDYKDIPQDRAAGVETIYTLLLGHGHSLRTVHYGVTTALTLVLLVPIVVLGVLTRFDLVLVPLVVAAVVPQALLILLDNRLYAVESALWAINAYLALMTVAITVLGPVGV
jgi:hypothetical protein